MYAFNSFILESNNIKKDSFIWNMLGGIFNSFQSVIILMVITRKLGVEQAGIFTLAYANANMFMTIGKFGVRNFQVTDSKTEYTFEEYRVARILTIVAMIGASTLYLIYIQIKNEYSLFKFIIIFLMNIYKITDAYQDVYEGEYQKLGRLDIAAKILALKVITSTLLIVLGVYLFNNLFWTLLMTVLYAFIFMNFLLKCSKGKFNLEGKYSLYNVKKILLTCLPLCLCNFLILYIGNACKYSIDKFLSDEEQAYYAFISMPIFVIGVLNNFITNPVLLELSNFWNQKRKQEFEKYVLYLVIGTIMISIGCIMIANYWGCNALSILYNVDLSQYKRELVILMMGGGFLAMAGMLNAIITIMRLQKYLLLGYILVGSLAFMLSNIVVRYYGLTGASILYMVLMILLTICFGIIFFMGVKTKNIKQESPGQL